MSPFGCIALLGSLALGPGESPITCRVGDVGGVPCFVLDGRPHPGTCYSSYDCHPPRLEPRVRAFAEAGCDLVNFVVEISGYGYSRPMWLGPEEWDFRDLDERARLVLSAAPNALLLPRIYIDAPLWWCDSHPDELMVLGDGSTSFPEQFFALPRKGPYASVASEEWRADMRRALDKVIGHIEASDYGHRVIGYQLSGQKTEEWYHWSMSTPVLGDYSAPMQQAFRGWLAWRYGSDEALRQAWHREGARLSTATIPTQAERFGDQTRTFRDPVAEAPTIDFHRFWQWIMADTIAHFAHFVKERTGGTKVVGAFYAYTFEFTELAEDAGHLAVHQLERSPDIDFIMAPSSYHDRNLPGRPYFRAPVTSLHHHGVMFWNDFDQVSYKFREKLAAEPALATWQYQMGLTDTAEEFVWMNRREVGMELAQGIQVAHFDIHGGYYDDPEIMAGVRELAGLRRESLKLPDRGSSAQILLLADEDSEHYYSFRHGLMQRLLARQIAEMPFVAPYDAALLSDLDELDLSRYRLVVVLNAARVDRAMRETMADKLLRDGRTVIWNHAPGYFDNSTAGAANIARLTGIGVRPLEEVRETPVVGRGGGRVVGEAMCVPPGLAFAVDDPDAEILAATPDGTPVMARSDRGGWTSVFSAAVPIRAALLKRLARDVGVHIHCFDRDVAVFANRHYMTVCNGVVAGDVELRLPHPATVTDALTHEPVCEGGDRFALAMRAKEVRILATHER